MSGVLEKTSIAFDIIKKVIHKIGLCICFYDLLGCTEGLLGHNTGITNVNGILDMQIIQKILD